MDPNALNHGCVQNSKLTAVLKAEKQPLIKQLLHVAHVLERLRRPKHHAMCLPQDSSTFILTENSRKSQKGTSSVTMEMCEICPTAIVNCRHSDGAAKRLELGLAFIEVRQQDYIVLVIRISSWREATLVSACEGQDLCTPDHTTSGTSWTSSRCTSVTKTSSFLLLEEFAPILKNHV